MKCAEVLRTGLREAVLSPGCTPEYVEKFLKSPGYIPEAGSLEMGPRHLHF
jgi:hypothetical protein